MSRKQVSQPFRFQVLDTEWMRQQLLSVVFDHQLRNHRLASADGCHEATYIQERKWISRILVLRVLQSHEVVLHLRQSISSRISSRAFETQERQRT